MNQLNLFVMRKKIVPWILLFLLLDGFIELSAQSSSTNFSVVVSDLSLIATNTTPSPVSMTLSTSVSGSAIQPTTNSNMYIKITNIIPYGPNRKVTAIISNGNIPTGTLLKIQPAAVVTATGSGVFGNVVSNQVVLNKTANQTIISGIGSCFTGTGATEGYQVTFTWQPDSSSNYYLINANAGATSVTMTLTMSMDY